jgi:hypothetical protein
VAGVETVDVTRSPIAPPGLRVFVEAPGLQFSTHAKNVPKTS